MNKGENGRKKQEKKGQRQRRERSDITNKTMRQN